MMQYQYLLDFQISLSLYLLPLLSLFVTIYTTICKHDIYIYIQIFLSLSLSIYIYINNYTLNILNSSGSCIRCIPIIPEVVILIHIAGVFMCFPSIPTFPSAATCPRRLSTENFWIWHVAGTTGSWLSSPVFKGWYGKNNLDNREWFCANSKLRLAGEIAGRSNMIVW